MIDFIYANSAAVIWCFLTLPLSYLCVKVKTPLAVAQTAVGAQGSVRLWYVNEAIKLASTILTTFAIVLLLLMGTQET